MTDEILDDIVDETDEAIEAARERAKEARQYHPVPGDAADEVAADVELEEEE